MFISILTNNKGIALLMTLAFITLAITLAMETNRQSRFTIESCAVTRDRITAGQMAAAGVHAAMAVLIQDRYTTENDHLKEIWSDSEQLKANMDIVSFEEGRVEVAIDDLSARLQINALVDFPQGRQFVPLQQEIMTHMIQLVRDALEADEPETTTADIVNAIKDWLDSGDDEAITGLNGAESEYYQDQDPPYRCANGPIRHISELGRIKGISHALVYGREKTPGLASYLTVFGAQKPVGNGHVFPGKVNINTAPVPVLEALLPPEYSDLADIIVDYRDAADPAVLEIDDWYLEAPGASDLDIDPAAISISSRFFQIRATAHLHNVVRKVTAVVERLKATETEIWTCRILDWQLE